jgi:hypothetical protein
MISIVEQKKLPRQGTKDIVDVIGGVHITPRTERGTSNKDEKA